MLYIYGKMSRLCIEKDAIVTKSRSCHACYQQPLILHASSAFMVTAVSPCRLRALLLDRFVLAVLSCRSVYAGDEADP